ncbi:MAG: hypothetical protein NUK62_03890 [Tenericutes bacterium]|jgi:hypothetical protein|nr:hypothetical protein [Mycoplasmatota bacterium]
MRDEKVYHEYANWKLEHHELLKYLTDTNSDLIIRFKHVIDVTDHLYDKLIDDTTYTSEEDHIFETGFYYLADQINEIVDLLNRSYDNNIKDLENRSKDVNLLLSTIDFQNELLGVENFEQKDMDYLVQFEQDVLKKLENKEDVPIDMFNKLDQMTFDLFKRLDVEYFPINDIFLEIADELGIL